MDHPNARICCWCWNEVLNVDRLMKLLPEETNVLQGKLEHEIINPLASTIVFRSEHSRRQ